MMNIKPINFLVVRNCLLVRYSFLKDDGVVRVNVSLSALLMG